MRHIVMMRLQPGIFTEEVEKEYRDVFDQLTQVLPDDVLSAKVFKNCVDRSQNMTVMIEMQLRDASSLPKYLSHPLHVAMGQKYNPYVESIASFDCEEV